MFPLLHTEHTIRLADGAVLALGARPVVMGILNLTPDSFFDGGRYDPAHAVVRARNILDEGAELIDIGGESTRPGAEPVPLEMELARVIPAIEALRTAGITEPISIDTSKAEVAAAAIRAGASLINDVTGLQRDADIAAVAAQYGVPIIIMHWDRERDPALDLIDEIRRYFERSLAIAVRAGIAANSIILDPGFGFAKSLAENYRLLRELPRLCEMALPLLVGTSRKSMIGGVLGVPAAERLAGTLATTTIAYGHGAHVFRVHDVRPNHDALRIAAATLYDPEA